MEDHRVVMRIFLVAVLIPVLDASVNFNIPCVRCVPDPDSGIGEIGTPFEVQRSYIQNLDNPAVGRAEP